MVNFLALFAGAWSIPERDQVSSNQQVYKCLGLDSCTTPAPQHRCQTSIGFGACRGEGACGLAIRIRHRTHALAHTRAGESCLHCSCRMDPFAFGVATIVEKWELPTEPLGKRGWDTAWAGDGRGT
jgi:hypothetical protein